MLLGGCCPPWFLLSQSIRNRLNLSTLFCKLRSCVGESKILRNHNQGHRDSSSEIWIYSRQDYVIIVPMGCLLLAILFYPRILKACGLNPLGHIYIADTSNHRVGDSVMSGSLSFWGVRKGGGSQDLNHLISCLWCLKGDLFLLFYKPAETALQGREIITKTGCLALPVCQVMRWDVGGATGTAFESWRRHDTSH